MVIGYPILGFRKSSIKSGFSHDRTSRKFRSKLNWNNRYQMPQNCQTKSVIKNSMFYTTNNQTQISQAFKFLVWIIFWDFSSIMNIKTLKRVIAYWQFDSKICNFELTTKYYKIILTNWFTLHLANTLFKTFCSVGY